MADGFEREVEGPGVPGPVRAAFHLVPDGAHDGHGSARRILSQMQSSAFQGRKLGEAVDAWKRMIDGSSLLCAGLAGSMASAGLAPLGASLVERGYVDRVVATPPRVT